MAIISLDYGVFLALFGSFLIFVLSLVWYLIKSKGEISTPSRTTTEENQNYCRASTNPVLILSDPFDVSQKSRILPGPERARASIFTKNDEYLISDNPEVTTLYENFLYGLKRSKNGRCLGMRLGENESYQWLTYQEVLERAHSFGTALLNLNLESGSKFVGIYSQNRTEWAITSFACMSYSLIGIPLYDTLGAEAVAYIASQAELQVVVCDGIVKLRKMQENLDKMPSLKHVVVMDWSDDVSALSEEISSNFPNLKIHSFYEILNAVKKSDRKPLRLPKPADIFMVCYTSGTTGNPKGVLITHENCVSQVSSFVKIFDAYGVGLSVDDDAGGMMSYLPMAHMFEQVADAIVYNYGAKIGFFRGNINELLGDMKALAPNCFPVVPRLLNRLYNKIQANLVGNPVKRWLFNFAFRQKFAEMQRGVFRTNSFWDRLVFKKIQNEFGGRVRMMVTGSAPVAKYVLDLCRVMLGAVIFESYGQTECTAASTCTLGTETEAGHVGIVLPCCHIKLVDVPELEYFAKDDRGEVCVRGANVTKGYFMDPDKTAETYDADGWLHTGDVGMWQADGTLKIIDRKKHIFKLQQGEYVAPEKIENVYLRCPLVGQVFVDGSSFRRYLVAIVVPDEPALLKYAEDNGLGDLDFCQLCEHPDIADMILSEMQKTGKKNGLNSLEQVKAVDLCSDPFTLENGLLTPTMKSKRPQMRKLYTSRVEDLYNKNMYLEQDEMRNK